MKVRKLNVGATIEVGDWILNDSWSKKSWYRIVRTTKKFAIVAWNDTATGKFPRVVPEIGLRPCGKRDIWATTQYSAWRPVSAEVVQETPK